MARGRGLYVLLVLALLGDAFSVPAGVRLPSSIEQDNQIWTADLEDDSRDLVPAGTENRIARDEAGAFTSDNKEGESKVQTTTAKPEYATPVPDDDDSDEDDDFEPMNTAPSAGGGSNIFSLLRLANALFPSSSGANVFIRRILRRYFNNQLNTNIPIPIFPNAPSIQNYPQIFNPSPLLRRHDVDGTENRIDIDEIQGLTPPPFQRQETEETAEDDDSDDDESSEESDENNAAESVEDGNGNNGNSNGNASKQKSGSEENGKPSDDNNSDYSDEPPEGDGQGGGILGILAGLSGGEDGQSDLGSLLATVGGIVANLSGDGFDLNALIASGLGLFVGLLSEGEENPGEVIASYLLTSLDTITGGGAKNNGAFFGKLISKLLRGVSAGGDPEESLEEGQEPEKDSFGFFKSLLMGLLGEMSKGSSSSSFKSSSCSGSCSEQPAAEGY